MQITKVNVLQVKSKTQPEHAIKRSSIYLHQAVSVSTDRVKAAVPRKGRATKFIKLLASPPCLSFDNDRSVRTIVNMAKEDFMKGVLFVVNVIYALFGLASAATGIWFFVQLSEFVALRNSNHYLLDYRVYWPQVAPWFFILLGLFIMMVSFCGWCGTNKESRGLLGIYSLFLVLIILGQLITATLIFVYVDGEDTDRFIKDTVYDGYYNTQSNPDVFKSFGRIERKLRCCGANDARDYRSWRNDLPLTCCADSYYRATCDFTDKEANERLGCAKVASVYVKIISSSVAGASLLIALLEITGVIVAYRLFRSFEEVEHYIHERKEGETEC